jgi:5-methylcytosine-specific restriction endonuclease McrA
MPQRIPSHKPPRLAGRPKRDESRRPNAAARGYCDKAHRAWRQAVLTRDAWQCQACGRVCGDKREAQADHVIPIAQGGSRYDISNGQCLCIACHGRKTRSEQQATAKAKAEATPGLENLSRYPTPSASYQPEHINPGVILYGAVRDSPYEKVAPASPSPSREAR